MQRQGGFKYSATAGKYRSSANDSKTPNFVEGTLIYGLPWNTTLYGGTILSGDYQSYALGLGLNLGDFGAVSFDIKNSSTKFDFDNKKQNGQAYRLQYSKLLPESHSSINLNA